MTLTSSCRIYKTHIMVIIGFLLISQLIPNQIQSQTPIHINRVKETIRFDGLCNEEAWQQADPLPMVQQTPVFGNPSTEKTEIFLLYDEDYLYLGGRLYYSDPAQIQATSKKRDFLGGNSDLFGIIIDTFNDNENAMGFFTTPAGLRLDLTIFNDAQGRFPINLSWNTYWDVKHVCNDQGWFVEMRIPFTSLRFQEKEGKIVMGIIAWRWIAAKSEQLIFPAISTEYGRWSAWKPSLARDIVIQDIPSRKSLYITPYTLTGFGLNNDLNDAETAYEKQTDTEFEIGLDAKYSLTSNLTLDMTANTDFAQVEADNEKVNLTRFSLFFPEKRLFFQERSSNFNFNLRGPDRLFYSRRIGLDDDGNPVRIYGGARMVGRIGKWDVGLLNLQTAKSENLPSENFGVFRLRKQVINPNSYVGGIVTTRMGADNTYNLAYGVDGIFRVKGDDYLKIHLAQTMEDSVNNQFLSRHQTHVGFTWEKRKVKGFAYKFDLSRSGRDFNPGAGFEMRDDFTRFGTKLLLGWIPGEKSALLRHNIYIDGSVFIKNEDKSVESVAIGPGWEFSLKNESSGKVSSKFFYEAITDTFELDDDVFVPNGNYSFYNLSGYYYTSRGKKIYSMFFYNAGSFYDGWRVSIGTMPTWSISSDFGLSGFYQFNHVVFPDRHQKLTAHIARIRGIWMMSTALSISALIQYNSAAKGMITNIRLRYNPIEGNDLYLVYDEGFNTHRQNQNPFPPITSNRTFLVKYSYTFIM